MSYADYEKFKQDVYKCKYFKSIGGINEQKILKAEELLGLKFSKQCREFYEGYGYVSFEGTEIFGINPDNLNVYAANSVAMALHERKDYGLPHEWLPIYDFEDGFIVFQDYSQLNSDGEPIVIVGGYNGEKYIQAEKIAEDFGEFVLKLVMIQLELQKGEEQG